MDAYTREVASHLDRRFALVDGDGIYLAHQPIYGFRKGHSEERLIERYVITLQIMKALARLRFDSLIDVGAAEGYKAALARDLFGVPVRVCDLSAEACRRAKEIYGLEGEGVDIHHLPYDDGQFDVVLSSETLEHVADLAGATRELLRVARRAVVITVPREPPEIVARNIREGALGAHIHALDLNSFDELAPKGAEVVRIPILSSWLKIPFALIEAVPREEVVRYPKAFLRLYNRCVPTFRRIFGRRAALQLIRADQLLARMGRSYSGMVIIIAKDPSCLLKAPRLDVTPERVLEFAVPYHRPSTATQTDAPLQSGY